MDLRCYQCGDKTSVDDSMPYRIKGNDVVVCFACTCQDCGDIIDRGMGVCEECHQRWCEYAEMHDEFLREQDNDYE